MTNTQVMWRINSGLFTPSLQLQHCVEASYLKATSQRTTVIHHQRLSRFMCRHLYTYHATLMHSIRQRRRTSLQFCSSYSISQEIKCIFLGKKGMKYRSFVIYLPCVVESWSNKLHRNTCGPKSNYSFTVWIYELLQCEQVFFFPFAVVLWQHFLILYENLSKGHSISKKTLLKMAAWRCGFRRAMSIVHMIAAILPVTMSQYWIRVEDKTTCLIKEN